MLNEFQVDLSVVSQRVLENILPSKIFFYLKTNKKTPHGIILQIFGKNIV